MAQLHTHAGTKEHAVVSREEWLAARKALLAKEKEFTRLGDELNQKRRDLPWVKIEKDYLFEGPKGPESLADLFGKRHQLIVYHFMFNPESDQGCPHCSFWADHYDSMGLHLSQRDTSFVVISRAPIDKLLHFQQRMGWKFKWVSSGKNDFNYDFHVSFRPEQFDKGSASYNYEKFTARMADREGTSVFYKDDGGGIFHTYSCYARGIDILNGTYHFLDLTPMGRDEPPGKAQAWVRYHDKYQNL